MAMKRLKEREMAEVQGDKEICLAIINGFGNCEGCSAYCGKVADVQLAADQQVLAELFEEAETLFIPAYKEGELVLKSPTDWLITISHWQALKKKYLGEKK